MTTDRSKELPSLADGSRRATSKSDPQWLPLASNESGTVVKVLASETARTMFSSLYDAPRTPSELAAEVETTVQNVHHHLERLSEAGLVEPVGVEYSKKGKKMKVYAPTEHSIVLYAGPRPPLDTFRSVFPRFIGAFGLLALLSIVVGRLAEVARPETIALYRSPDVASSILWSSPGIIFFAGGVTVLAGVTLWWLWSNPSVISSGDARRRSARSPDR